MGAIEAEERDAILALETELGAIPNRPLPEVPQGADENDNVALRLVGAKPVFPAGFTPKEHFEIGEALGLMDFEAAARMSGARFVVLKGQLARLERALAQFMLDLHTDEHGYQEVAPPLLVREPPCSAPRNYRNSRTTSSPPWARRRRGLKTRLGGEAAAEGAATLPRRSRGFRRPNPSTLSISG